MKAKATGPVLFGKPGELSQENGWCWLNDPAFVHVVRRGSDWHFRVSVNCFLVHGSQVPRRTPQAAANDAERFLRKLKAELEGMGA